MCVQMGVCESARVRKCVNEYLRECANETVGGREKACVIVRESLR